MQKAGDRTVR